MKQKKIFWSFLAVLMVIVLSAGVVSCSNDDDDDDDDGISGTSWVYEERYSDWRETVTLTFRSGGRGTIVIKDEDPYSGTDTETETFTYTYDSRKQTGTITAKEYDSYRDRYANVTYEFEVERNKLYVYVEYGDEIVFTKK